MLGIAKQFLMAGDSLKGFFTLAISTILASIYVIEIAIILYSVLFVFDMLFGLIKDKLSNTKVSLNRLWRSTMLLCIYISINFLISIVCHMNGDVDAGDTALRIITYACAYFYAINIFKNLSAAFPDVRFFAFLYYLLSFEVVKMIPGLQKFNEQNKENERIEKQ